MNINEAIQQKKFENEWEKALVNLHFTSNMLNDQLIAVLKPYAINDQHYNILRILNGRYPDVACPGDIKAVLLNKRGDLTRLLDKLDKLNYIERATNPSNRRMVDLKITKTGIALLKKLKTEIHIIKTLKNKLTEAEAIQLSSLLDKIRL